MKIKVDRDVCIGAGQCVLSVPDVFDQDDDGIVTLLAEEVGEDLAARVRDAAAACPSQAIQVLDA